MRRYLSLIITVSIFGGVIFTLVNTPWVVRFVTPRLIAHFFPQVTLSVFRVERQAYRYPATLDFFDVQIDFEYEGNLYHFHSAKVRLPNVISLNYTLRQFEMMLTGMALETPVGKITDGDWAAQFHFKNYVLLGFEGVCQNMDLTAGRYHLTGTSAKFKGAPQRLQILEVNGSAFGGRVTGQTILEYKDFLNYIIWIEFQDLPSQELKTFAPNIFSGLQGNFSGSIRINGDLEQIDLLAINLTMKGGTVTPQLIRAWSKEAGVDPAKILAAAKAGKDHPVPVQTVAFGLHSLNDHNISFTLKLEDAPGGLNLMDSINLDFPQGLKGLIF